MENKNYPTIFQLLLVVNFYGFGFLIAIFDSKYALAYVFGVVIMYLFFWMHNQIEDKPSQKTRKAK